jgi:hypothetical protein
MQLNGRLALTTVKTQLLEHRVVSNISPKQKSVTQAGTRTPCSKAETFPA